MEDKKLTTFDLQLFAGEGDEGTDKGGDDQNKDTNKDEKTFTQADLDKIVADRLAREQKKYADYEELKKFRQLIKTYLHHQTGQCLLFERLQYCLKIAQSQ